MYDLNRVRANTAYYLSQGRCPRCGGKQPVEPGLKRCKQCGIKESQGRARRRKQLAATGRCPSCGRPREDAEFKTCRHCRGYIRDYFAAKKNEKKRTEETA